MSKIIVVNQPQYRTKILIDGGHDIFLLVKDENYSDQVIDAVYFYKKYRNNTDIIGSESLQQELMNFSPDFTFASNEKEIPLATELAELLKCIGPCKNKEQIQFFYDKAYMREVLNDSTLHKLDELKNSTIPKGHYILKPTDGVGSEGVIDLKVPQQYWDDIKSSLLKNKKYTIEKYIDGEEFAFDYFIRDGKLTLLGVNKTYLFSDSFVEKAHLSGTHFNNKTLSRISSKISSIMSRINYFNGALHIELKFDASKDTFKFLEFHPRPGGDFMPLLNKLSSGNDITEHYLSYFSNSKPPKYLTERDTSKKISCYLYYFPIYFSPDAIYDSTWSQHQEDLRNINFDPRSNSLYSHTLAKSSDASKRSVDTLLASFEQIARTLKKQYICSGIRLPLYKKFSHQLTIDQYIRESWEGKIPDPLIDLAKRNGWARGNVIEEYYNDSASLNFGLWVYKRVL